MQSMEFDFGLKKVNTFNLLVWSKIWT